MRRRSTLVALVLVAVASLTACLPEWPTPTGDYAGNAANAAESVITARNVGTLQPSWQLTTKPPGSYAPPVISNGVLLTVESRSTVVARDAATGRTRWTHAYPGVGEVRLNGVAGDGLLVDVIPSNGVGLSLVALATKDGHQLWTRSHPYPNDSIVFVTAGAGLVFTSESGPGPGEGRIRYFDALDAGTGRPVWNLPCRISSGGVAGTGLGCTINPELVTYAAGRLYATTANGNTGAEMRVLDARTGRLLSNGGYAAYYRSTGPPELFARPTVAGGFAYVTDASGNLAAYRTDCPRGTCSPAWFRVGDEPASNAARPVVAVGGRVFVSTRPGPDGAGLGGGTLLLALDGATGRRLWSADGIAYPVGALSAAGDVVYVGRQTVGTPPAAAVFAFAAAGCGTAVCKPRWQWTPPVSLEGAISPPVALGGRLYVTHSTFRTGPTGIFTFVPRT